MPASDAQIAANRRNARLSTGPQTPEGKERARRNSWKHGLTASVVLPGEEAGEAADRVAALQAKLAPDDDDYALILAERAGYLTLRLRRCFVHEEAMTARRVRAAAAEYDDEQFIAAAQAWDGIAADPATGARRLRGTPAGVDLLVRCLEELRGEVDGRWSRAHADQFDRATGRRPEAVPGSRVRALTDLATRGDAAGLRPGEVDAVPAAGRGAWALGEIAREVDAELRRLHAGRETLDHARFAADRAEAGKRAMQGTDRETMLAQRYEAAAARAFTQTLRQLDEYRREQDRAAAVEEVPAADPVAAAPDLMAELRDRFDRGPDPLADDPIPDAGLGSFGRTPRRAAGPIDAFEFTIGKPAAPAAAAPRGPRSAP